MPDRMAKCNACGETFSARVLRYVKAPDGTWKYLCTECRRVWHGEYKIDHAGGESSGANAGGASGGA